MTLYDLRNVYDEACYGSEDYPSSHDEALRAVALAVIEEAAKECERLWDTEAAEAIKPDAEPRYHDCIECAHAIRSLKDTLK